MIGISRERNHNFSCMKKFVFPIFCVQFLKSK